jgi:hypothetical protein
MQYLYQKDEWALPGNLQNWWYNFLPPLPNVNIRHYFPTFFLSSLALTKSLNG